MVKPTTTLEKVLYEERQQVISERDKLKEEIKELKDKESMALMVMGGEGSNSYILVKKGNSIVSLDRNDISELIRYADKERFL